MKKGSCFPWFGFLGLVIIIISGIGLYLNLWFFETFMTPACWTGLILFLDALNYRLAGNSLIKTRRKEFLWMLPWSIALWYFFEFYNLFIQNWYYVGLPESRILRYFGYFWSFATIWPGVFEIFDLIRNSNLIMSIQINPFRLSKVMLNVSVIFGMVCMVLPIIVSHKPASYMAVLVWLGMIFIIDPINYRNRGFSLWENLSKGSLTILIQLFLTGLIAGIFWEFWNYWATAKWIYSVPILGHIKVFEMPILGYLGFLPFAVEVYVMWELVKKIIKVDQSAVKSKV